MINNKNNQRIFMASAIAGVLDFLNRKVKIEQTVNGKITEHAIKFYYNFGQDEQFMKDFFIEYSHGCVLYEHAEGNFDERPLGVMKFDGFGVRPNDITNRFVRGTYLVESLDQNEQKKIDAFSAYLMRIPVTIKMSMDMQADNLGQAMRLNEAILDVLYKSNVMFFQHKGLRIPGEILMEDDITLDKKTQFTFDDSQIAHVKFGFEINTVYPVFDEYSAVSKTQALKEFRSRWYGNTSTSQDDPLASTTVDEDYFIEGLSQRTINVYYDLSIENDWRHGG